MAMKDRVSLYVILLGLVAVLFTYYVVNHTGKHYSYTIGVEYQLEILNQDSVAIRNVDSGTTYRVDIDSIQVTLLKDNM